MEETNYHRPALARNTNVIGVVGQQSHESGIREKSGERIETQDENGQSVIAVEGQPDESETRKTWFDKLRLLNTEHLRYPNRSKNMIIRPFIFLSFPVISYAGFSYGSNLIWFNVLNDTTSLILSKRPYNFNSSMVGLAYIAPFVGMALG